MTTQGFMADRKSNSPTGNWNTLFSSHITRKKQAIPSQWKEMISTYLLYESRVTGRIREGE